MHDGQPMDHDVYSRKTQQHLEEVTRAMQD